MIEASWKAPPGVRACTLVRGETKDHALTEKLAGLAGLEQVFWLRQCHSAAVVRANAAEPRADASITTQRGIGLAVRTADCVPIVLAAEDGGEIAVAHAGWRGIAKGILENTLRAMHTRPENLIAWLGPAISQEHYEVGPEVREAFIACSPKLADSFHDNTRGRWQADLPAACRALLQELGVTQISGGDLCTFADPSRFHSHRREPGTGHLVTIVWRT